MDFLSSLFHLVGKGVQEPTVKTGQSDTNIKLSKVNGHLQYLVRTSLAVDSCEITSEKCSSGQLRLLAYFL